MELLYDQNVKIWVDPFPDSVLKNQFNTSLHALQIQLPVIVFGVICHIISLDWQLDKSIFLKTGIGFLVSGLSTCDFSTLYTTFPHNLIKEKLTELIKQTFNREGSHTLFGL